MLSSVPAWAWTIVYYLALISAYRFIIHPYIHSTLERQIIGPGNSAAMAAVILLYLLLCAIPPFALSRGGKYHPVWRGVESFTCYAGVALIMGALFSLGESGGWTPTSGLSASGPAWASIGSTVGLFLVFLAASWWGGKGAGKRGRRKKSGSRARSRPTSS